MLIGNPKLMMLKNVKVLLLLVVLNWLLINYLYLINYFDVLVWVNVFIYGQAREKKLYFFFLIYRFSCYVARGL